MTISHKIVGDAMQLVVCQVDDNQTVYAEAGKFLWKTVNVGIETRISNPSAAGSGGGGGGLLGMAVNLIGQPSETTGAAHAVSIVLLGLHVVVAIGLVAGAVMVIRAARGGGDRPRQLARSGAVLIGLTVIAGVMTVITKNNWWSYAMATGFIASVLLYGSLLVRAQSLAPQPGQPS